MRKLERFRWGLFKETRSVWCSIYGSEEVEKILSLIKHLSAIQTDKKCKMFEFLEARWITCIKSEQPLFSVHFVSFIYWFLEDSQFTTDLSSILQNGRKSPTPAVVSSIIFLTWWKSSEIEDLFNFSSCSKLTKSMIMCFNLFKNHKNTLCCQIYLE